MQHHTVMLRNRSWVTNGPNLVQETEHSAFFVCFLSFSTQTLKKYLQTDNTNILPHRFNFNKTPQADRIPPNVKTLHLYGIDRDKFNLTQ